MTSIKGKQMTQAATTKHADLAPACEAQGP
jgi:hypothetical protein